MAASVHTLCGLELVNQALCSQSEQLGDASKKMLVCFDEHNDQLLIMFGCGKKSRIHKKAKAELQRIQAKPLGIVEVIPPSCMSKRKGARGERGKEVSSL